MSETELVRSILATLARMGIWAWRANAGSRVMPATDRSARRMFRGAPAGTPDILGVLPGGRLFGLEAKTARGRVRPSQSAWHATAERHGVLVAVVRSVSEALAAVDRWRLAA